MRAQWTLAAFLSAALFAGCSGTNDNSQNSPQELTPDAASQGSGAAATAPAAPAGTPANTTTPSRVSQNRTVSPAQASGQARDLTPAPADHAAGPPAAAAPVRPTWHEVTLAAGTAVPLEITSAVSTETAQIETPVTARVYSAIAMNGETVVPAGATLKGTVTEVERPGRVQGRAHLAMKFTEIRLPDGTERMMTNPVSFEGDATKSEDATKVGIGAGAGAVIGGILGGKGGAGKGAIAGAAAGTGVVLATRGRELVVDPGTQVTATLASPLTVRIAN